MAFPFSAPKLGIAASRDVRAGDNPKGAALAEIESQGNMSSNTTSKRKNNVEQRRGSAGVATMGLIALASVLCLAPTEQTAIVSMEHLHNSLYSEHQLL